jgi:hypothetical protein
MSDQQTFESDGHVAADEERIRSATGNRNREGEPDVLVDLPQLRVEEVNLEVDDLRANVTLHANVLDLLRLDVGAQVSIARVQLGINTVEAQAQVKVRLEDLAEILDRVLTTIDRNPQIIEQLVQGIGRTVERVGQGAGQAVGQIGEGASSAVHDVGRGAGQALGDVGEGAGSAVQDVGHGAGQALGDVGEGTGSAVKDVGSGLGGAGT